MDAINLMVEEHKNIKLMLKIVRKVAFNIMNGGQVNFDEFDKIIDFIRNYADKHHHKKEEDYLFNKMVEEIGPTAEKVVNQGMLVEHDWGRLFIRRLDEALKDLKEGKEEAKLDIVANAVGYNNLLKDHIHKEDNVIYNFARRQLKAETLEKINEECESFEKETIEEAKKYLDILTDLAKKYEIEMEE